MEQGFDLAGKPVEAESDECRFLLVELQGRPIFRWKSRDEEFGSMYGFGSVVSIAIRNGFDWTAVLLQIPDPGTDERFQLRDKLLGQWEEISSYIEDELNVQDYSFEAYSQVVELFSRLYPAYGHFEDKISFLSDNFYSFEPAWSFQSYHTAPDFRTMIAEAFGVYRKDLAREVARSTGSAIALFSRFSSSVTIEEVTALFQNYAGSDLRDWSFVGTDLDRAMEDNGSFNRLNPALRLRLIHDFFDSLLKPQSDGFLLSSIVRDTLLMLNSIPASELKRFRSDRNWDQVHSRAVGLASDEDVSGLGPLSFPRELEELDGQSLKDSTGLKLLRSPFDFLRAGSKSGLDNCMGSAGYYTKAKNGESYCLVGYSQDKLTLGIELKQEDGGWKILQLNGPGNKAIEDRRDIEDELVLKLTGEPAKKVERRIRAKVLPDYDVGELQLQIARIEALPLD